MPNKDPHEEARLRGLKEQQEGLSDDEAGAKWLDRHEHGLARTPEHGPWTEQPPTIPQMRVLRSLGIPPLGLTRGQASKKISEAMQRRNGRGAR